MEKIATDLDKHHAFQVDIDKLLGTQEKVDHPQCLACVIPNHICRSKFFLPPRLVRE